MATGRSAMQGHDMAFVVDAPEDLLSKRLTPRHRATCLHEEHRLDLRLHIVRGELLENCDGGIEWLAQARSVIERKQKAYGVGGRSCCVAHGRNLATRQTKQRAKYG